MGNSFDKYFIEKVVNKGKAQAFLLKMLRFIGWLILIEKTSHPFRNES